MPSQVLDKMDIEKERRLTSEAPPSRLPPLRVSAPPREPIPLPFASPARPC
jgi:hypothetical protein